MDTDTPAKPGGLNTLEGLVLSALLQWFPTFATTVLMLKLVREHRIVSDPGGAVLLASPIAALLARWLGP